MYVSRHAIVEPATKAPAADVARPAAEKSAVRRPTSLAGNRLLLHDFLSPGAVVRRDLATALGTDTKAATGVTVAGHTPGRGLDQRFAGLFEGFTAASGALAAPHPVVPASPTGSAPRGFRRRFSPMSVPSTPSGTPVTRRDDEVAETRPKQAVPAAQPVVSPAPAGCGHEDIYSLIREELATSRRENRALRAEIQQIRQAQIRSSADILQIRQAQDRLAEQLAGLLESIAAQTRAELQRFADGQQALTAQTQTDMIEVLDLLHKLIAALEQMDAKDNKRFLLEGAMGFFTEWVANPIKDYGLKILKAGLTLLLPALL
jgi:hypothetical protein